MDEGTLREAQRISRFAVASYGLQSVIWAQGERPGACLANANRLVKCFKAPLGLETSLRKQNFDAIVRITGEGEGQADRGCERLIDGLIDCRRRRCAAMRRRHH